MFADDVPAGQEAKKADIPAKSTAADAAQDVVIRAETQEYEGAMVRLRGAVYIRAHGYELRADQATYNTESGEATAQGNLQLSGGQEDLLIHASHGTYNVKTETGKFYDVAGTTGMRYRGGAKVTLTSSNPFAFRGKEVDRLGPEDYQVLHGMVTTCQLPNPKWSFRSGHIKFHIGGVARIYNTTFWLKDIPILYLPFAQHPVEQLGRQTGFLIPTFGESSSKGFIVGDAFYWAINRSSDATLGAEYFSQRGSAEHGDFRARPSETSAIDVTYFGVIDRGLKTTDANGNTVTTNQGGEDVTAYAYGKLPWGFYGSANIEYLSRYIFRLAFTENFAQAVNSEVKSDAFATRTFDGYSFSIFARRYQNFQSTVPGDVITILHTPSLEFNSVERSLAGPLDLSFDAAAESLSRREPGLRTASSVGRVDVYPELSLPAFLNGWSFRPSLAARETYYTQELLPNGNIGVAGTDDVNRNDVEAEFEMRPPTLVRVFDTPVLHRKLKHTIEQQITYRYVNGIENFARILRFDERDIASDTNEVEYTITNRLYARGVDEKQCPPDHPDADDAKCAAGPRESLTWEIGEKYFLDPTFGGAVVNGRRNVFTSSEDFTGIAFLTGPRNFSPVVSRLRAHSSSKTEVEWALDYDPKMGHISSSNVSFNYQMSQWRVGASDTLLRTPGEVFTSANIVDAPTVFHQYRLLGGYGSPSKRGISFAGNVGVDVRTNDFQYSAAQTSYNWDCCGLSFEYRRFGLGSVRNENQFRFALTLANIGSFGNMKRQERLF